MRLGKITQAAWNRSVRKPLKKRAVYRWKNGMGER